MVHGEMGMAWIRVGAKRGVDMSWRSMPALCLGVCYSVDAHRGGHKTVKLFYMCCFRKQGSAKSIVEK